MPDPVSPQCPYIDEKSAPSPRGHGDTHNSGSFGVAGRGDTEGTRGDAEALEVPTKLQCRSASFEAASHEGEGHSVPLSGDPVKRRNQLANLRNAPAAPQGNSRHRVHGAYARVLPFVLDAKATTIFDALAGDAPVRADDGGLPAADALPVRLLAELLCRLDSIGEYLGRRGWEGEDGQPRPVLDVEARLRGQAVELMRELGLTPASRVKLGVDLVRGLSAAERLDDHLSKTYGGGAG
jgi:hypothetical protein